MGKSERPFKCPYKCPYIKRDGSICGNPCWRIKGCSLHWTKYERNAENPLWSLWYPYTIFYRALSKTLKSILFTWFSNATEIWTCRNTPVLNSWDLWYHRINRPYFYKTLSSNLLCIFSDVILNFIGNLNLSCLYPAIIEKYHFLLGSFL